MKRKNETEEGKKKTRKEMEENMTWSNNISNACFAFDEICAVQQTK